MKKINLILAINAVLVLIASCASTPQQAQPVPPAHQPHQPPAQQPHQPPAVQPFAATPAWLNDDAPLNELWGVGFLRIDNETLAMQAATEFARHDAARQVSTLVQGLIRTHMQTTGLINNPRSTIFLDNVGRGLLDMRLATNRVNQRTRMPDGTWFVRISISKQDAINEAVRIVDHEMADFAEFQAWRATQEMERLLANMQSTPEPFGGE